MKRENSSLAQYVLRFHIGSQRQFKETPMNPRHVEKAKVGTGMNPLWVITVAMAIFFAAATAVVALG